MRKTILLILALAPLLIKAQDAGSPLRIPSLQFGFRSTVSLFTDDDGSMGTGAGAQFRIRLAKKLNTEWFGDYITSDIFGMAHRQVAHIGWSVMFYPFNGQTTKGHFTPYILAGHCFDYTSVKKNASTEPAVDRWSSAVQGGIGTHYNFTDYFDMSFSAQYMMHLGDEVNAEKFTDASGNQQLLITRTNTGLEGHLLITLSCNFVIPDLRKKK